jgi:hypothetical protein
MKTIKVIVISIIVQLITIWIFASIIGDWDLNNWHYMSVAICAIICVTLSHMIFDFFRGRK